VGLYIFYYTLLCYSSRTLQTPSQARASRPKCVHMYICTQVSSMRIYVFICMSVYIFIYINVSEKIPRTISCTFHELYHLYVTADEACKFHELCLLHITHSVLYLSRTLSRHPNVTNSVFYILRTVSCTSRTLSRHPNVTNSIFYISQNPSRTLSCTHHKLYHSYITTENPSNFDELV